MDAGLDAGLSPDGAFDAAVDAVRAGLPAAAAAARLYEQLTPDERLGLISQSGAFFRSGASRQWDDVLTQEDVAVYEKRLAALASPELRRWLQGGESGE